MHESPKGELFAISHAASEANLPEGQSTQHMQLQYAVMIYGAMRGAGRFAVEPEQKSASKLYARSVINNSDPKAHGGLRLQKHEGKHVIDVSGTFSFQGANDANMQHVARFYATVLRHADPPGEQVHVMPAHASCNQKFATEAEPHLQDLARRINDILED